MDTVLAAAWMDDGMMRVRIHTHARCCTRMLVGAGLRLREGMMPHSCVCVRACEHVCECMHAYV
jgi:hypothetical protein